MRRLAALVVVALSVATAAATAQQYRIPPDSVVQRILDEQVGPKHTVGIVVGLLDADGTRRILTAGKTDKGDLALDANTLFEIGSITKTFTTALLADAVRRGEVKLDDPVQKYLPASVKIPGKDGKVITLYDLATVSSGLPGMPNNFAPKDRTNPYADYTVEQMYQFLNGYTLTRLPGEKYEYSNLGMGLLGHALAVRAKKSYYDLLAERILKPLGMNDTWIVLTPALEARMAQGHDQNGRPVSVWDIPTLAGAGALRSSVNDMFKYLAANLDTTSKPLGPTLAMTHGRQRPGPAPALSVGLGWHRFETPAKNIIVWHNGGTGGFRTFTGFDPVRKVGIIVLTNSAISADDVGLHLLDPSMPLSPPPAPKGPAPKEIEVTEAVLNTYVGEYELAPNFTITVTVEGSALMMRATGQEKLRARGSSLTEFFIPEVEATVTFVSDSTGKVTGLLLRQGGGEAPAKKIR